jgi:adenylosuccinate synthase
MAITKLDVLTGLETLKICTGYEVNGQMVHQRPASLKRTEQCKPIYKEMPGWKEDITGAREKKDLPQAALDYLSAIEDITGVPVSIISVGPNRNETIVVKLPGS